MSLAHIAAAALILFSSFSSSPLILVSALASTTTTNTNSNNNNNPLINNMLFSPRKSSLATIRVVTYNLLSPNLATTSSYPTLNPNHLDPDKRLGAILSKLDQELSQQRTVVCLQEVSYAWAGSLHTYFSNRGYHMVTGLYGRPFNGYMGVAMAWPTAAFETVDVDISRLSDTREGGWPKDFPLAEGEQDSRNDKPCFSIFSWLLPKRKQSEERPPIEPWDYSKRRFNVMLTATLKEKDSGKSFCVSNYHMPCAFYAPQVMTMHSELAAHRVQTLAKQHCKDLNEDSERTTSLPYILAGDWNIKPQDAAYQLLTTGTLASDDPAFPEPAKSTRKATRDQVLQTWESRITGMRSAYATLHDGKEPDFTNYAAPRAAFDEGGEVFIDTLDYIFLSPEWTVKDMTQVPSRETVKGPFPNLEDAVREPSDHILLAAKLELKD